MANRDMKLLWQAPAEVPRFFEPAGIASLPEPARRYLLHSIAPGTPLVTAFKLRMRGEIKLKGTWCPFTAEQVTRAWDGFVWRARVVMKGLPVFGSDRWIKGTGAMKWKLLGLLSVASGDGPDISRSALGRMQGEMIWLPTALLQPQVKWSSRADDHVRAEFESGGSFVALDLSIDADGRVHSLAYLRWGNPGVERFGEHPFGGEFDSESTFQGVTIPNGMHIGWNNHPGRPRQEWEGFRATIEYIEFR
ncbi:MAG: hypothetical protein KF696_04615 [Planctomycetes bacterium]|nr:hypothetical protein [Planctomycetota bacterium]MCW8134256.1 hypothetical protein [Planctomycetota bacterium]